MILSELSLFDLNHQLCGPGLVIRTGPFKFQNPLAH